MVRVVKKLSLCGHLTLCSPYIKNDYFFNEKHFKKNRKIKENNTGLLMHTYTNRQIYINKHKIGQTTLGWQQPYPSESQ